MGISNFKLLVKFKFLIIGKIESVFKELINLIKEMFRWKVEIGD